MSNILTYEEAYQIVKENFKLIKPSIIEIDILDSVNHLLAEDIVSDIDMPPFDNSQMDGYAVKYNDEIREWTVIGEISAGNFKEIEISENSTVSIMTGAKLPVGADTIIPVEDVVRDFNKIKLIGNKTLKKGSDVRYKGEDIKKGSIAIHSGTLIKTNNIPLLTACGKSRINVMAPLRIGFFTTGDELVDINIKPENDQIRSSNLYSLTTLINELNMIPVNFGIIKDDKNLIKDTVNKALESDIDILITTGGVSVGKYDYLKDVIEESGFELVFWKARVKPGKPLLFCIHKKTGKVILFFGLPGNPVSAFVSFNLFIKPFISELYKYPAQKRINAFLENDITKKDDRLNFARGKVHFDTVEKKYKVKKSGAQSSGDMASLSDANCLIIFDADKYILNAGDEVECIMI